MVFVQSTSQRGLARCRVWPGRAGTATARPSPSLPPALGEKSGSEATVRPSVLCDESGCNEGLTEFTRLFSRSGVSRRFRDLSQGGEAATSLLLLSWLGAQPALMPAPSQRTAIQRHMRAHTVPTTHSHHTTLISHGHHTHAHTTSALSSKVRRGPEVTLWSVGHRQSSEVTEPPVWWGKAPCPAAKADALENKVTHTQHPVHKGTSSHTMH